MASISGIIGYVRGLISSIIIRARERGIDTGIIKAKARSTFSKKRAYKIRQMFIDDIKLMFGFIGSKKSDITILMLFLASLLTFWSIGFFVVFETYDWLDRAIIISTITASSAAVFFNPLTFPSIPGYLSSLNTLGVKSWKDEKVKEKDVVINTFIVSYSYLIFSFIITIIPIYIYLNFGTATITLSSIVILISVLSIVKKIKTPKIFLDYNKLSIKNVEKDPMKGLSMFGFGYSFVGIGPIGPILIGMILLSASYGYIAASFSMLLHGLLVCIFLLQSSVLIIYKKANFRLLSHMCDKVRLLALFLMIVSASSLLYVSLY